MESFLTPMISPWYSDWVGKSKHIECPVSIFFVGRRIDGLDNKIIGQEQSQRNMMDQMMKLSQELKVS